MIRLFALLALLLTTTPYTFAQTSAASAVDEIAAVDQNNDSPQANAEAPGESSADEGSENAPGFSLDNLEVESTSSSLSIGYVLPMAFLAGFLLNFMPCVLPVIGLKLMSFVQQAESDRRRIMLMNISFTAGLLSVMLILASLAVFAGLGWGEQFSSKAFTVSLATFVFAF